MFAKIDSRNTGFHHAKFPTDLGGGIRLGIQSINVAWSASLKNQNDRFGTGTNFCAMGHGIQAQSKETGKTNLKARAAIPVIKMGHKVVQALGLGTPTSG